MSSPSRFAGVALALSCAVPAFARAQTNPLFLGGTIPAGGEPASVAIGDFDGDGIADLVVGRGESLFVDTCMWLRGLVNGRFAVPVPFAVGGRMIRALEAADMNGDGRLDIVVASYAQSFVRVALGDGMGGFSVGAPAASGSNPSSLAVADFDGDGWLDAVSADTAPSLGTSGISLFRGDGAGGLTRIGGTITGPRPSAVVAADFDGDGWPDVAVANSSESTLSVLRNTGGAFAAPAQLGGFGYPYGLAAADLDADGDVDLAAGTNAGVRIAWNSGDGSFVTFSTLPYTVSVNALEIADVSNDGRADIVFADPARHVLGVLHGQGGGAFGDLRRYAAGDTPEALALGRVVGDARTDVVVANLYSRNLSVFEGSGAGFLAPEQFATTSRPLALAVVDFDRDGRADIVAGGEGARVDLLRGDGRGGFAEGASVTLPHGVGTLELGHFDGDDWIDLACGYGMQLTILRGTSTGSFAVHASYDVPAYVTSIASADFDGDGVLDLAVSGFLAGISILRGTGSGHFLPPSAPPVAPQAFTIEAFDADLDGRVDVVAVDGAHILVLQGSGTGVVEPPLVFPFPSSLRALAVADVDRDGDLDVVGANQQVWIARNDGHGNFGNVAAWLGGSDATDVAVGDLDADGWPDIVTADYGRHTLSALVADGSGGFLEPLVLAPGHYPIALEIADIDADGRSDLVVADFVSTAVAVLVNQVPVPERVRLFGSGTPDCRGELGLSANLAPRVGESQFAFVGTNAPPRAVGRVLVSSASDVAGSYPRRHGVLFHVGVAAADGVRSIPCTSDESGSSFARAPIPFDPALVGRVLFAQAFWHASTCSSSDLAVSSSRALRLEIGP